MPICPACRIGYDQSDSCCPKCGAAKPNISPHYPTIGRPVPDSGLPPPPVFSAPPDSSWGGDGALRCSGFSLVCLRFAQVAALLGVFASLYFGKEALALSEARAAFFAFCIFTPVTIGNFVAFGLIIRYAKYE